jgi:cation diffusion facilitator family transporter
MPRNRASSKSVRIRAALVSIFAGAAILVVKYYAASVSGSAALRPDAIESVVNVVAAVFALGAVIFAERPADREHPYGHGKIEHFSAAFEGGLVALAAAIIVWEATGNLYGQVVLGVHTIKDLGSGLVWSLVGGASNGALGLYLIFTGRRHRSKILQADGLHVVSDFVTTIGSISALLLVKVTGLQWLDPLAALVLGLLLARAGFRLVRESSNALLDIEDPALVEKIVGIINSVRPKDIISVHELRTLRSGRYTHIDIHMVVPSHYSLEKGHDLVEDFGRLLVAELGIEGEAQTHVDPCRTTLCASCAVEPCQARSAAPCPPEPWLTVEGATARDAPLRGAK